MQAPESHVPFFLRPQTSADASARSPRARSSGAIAGRDVRSCTAFSALEGGAEATEATLVREYPLADLPRGTVTHVLRVSALEDRGPVPDVVLLKTHDRTLQCPVVFPVVVLHLSPVPEAAPEPA